MSDTISLPQGHHIETVQAGSRFLGKLDVTTRQPIVVRDDIVVCRNVYEPAVVTLESWVGFVENCPNCGAKNPMLGGSIPGFSKDQGKKPLIIPLTPTVAQAPTIAAQPNQLPDGQRRRQQGSGVPIILILIALGVGILALGFIFAGLGNGPGANPLPTNRPPTSAGIAVIDPTPLPSPTEQRVVSHPPTAIPTLPPPTKRVLPPSSPKPATAPAPVSPIRELVLYDAVRDRALLVLSDGDSISLSQLGARYLDVEANIGSSPVGSIKFQLDGRDFCPNGRCVENTAPYSMVGDVNGDRYDNWDWNELLGTHTITAIPYTGRDVTGEQLPAFSVRLTITR